MRNSSHATGITIESPMTGRLQKFIATEFLVILVFSAMEMSASYPQTIPTTVHGGVIALELSGEENQVVFQGKRQLVWGGYAIIGVPLFTEPGRYDVEISTDGSDEVQTTAIDVQEKQYPEQHITLEDDNMVTPPDFDLIRINRETALMKEVYDHYSDLPTSDPHYKLPVVGPTSGVFGSRRFFNEQPRSPHSGIDFAAPTGTPVLAPIAGTVALTGSFYFNGNTVLIDHGGSLVSMLCHLDSIGVVEGEFVDLGDEIGKVGSSGRATGPHLHWTVSLAGDRIDPAEFMQVLDQIQSESE